MARRPSHTLIYLAANGTARLDLGAGPAFPVAGERWSPGAGEPAPRVAVALEGAAPAKWVWILWESAWVQSVEAPTAVTRDLPKDQLARTLAFETESLSGIGADASVLDAVAQELVPAAVSGDGERQAYWIAQTEASVVNSLAEAVADAGARLAGVVHPGGLPRESWKASDAAAAPREWRRIEAWNQAIVAVHGKADGSVATKIVNSRPGPGVWKTLIRKAGPIGWLGRGAPPDVSAADGGRPEWRIHEWPADVVPTDWLRAWAAELSAKPIRVPVVRRPAVESPRLPWIVGGAAAAVALAACILRFTLLSNDIAEARAAADAGQARHQAAEAAVKARQKALEGDAADKAKREAQEKELAAENEKLKTRLRALEKQEAALAADLDRTQRTTKDWTEADARRRERVAELRAAFPALLAELCKVETEERPSDLLVRDVKLEPSGELRLTGLCSRPAAADRFATRLSQRLSAIGWRIGPAQKRLRKDREAFDFSIPLSPSALADRHKPAAPEAPKPAVPPVVTEPKRSGSASAGPTATRTVSAVLPRGEGQ